MDNSATPLTTVFGITDQLIPLILDDLSDADSRTRSRGDEGPSIAWHLGHLLSYRCQGLRLLGETADNPYKIPFEDTPATDGADYPTTAELQAQWDAVGERFRTALTAATDDFLAEPAGDGPHAEQRVCDRFAFMAFHEGYHVGGIATIQKMIGKSSPSEKIIAAMKAAG